MLVGGLLLATMHFVLRRMEGKSEDSEDLEDDSAADGSEPLHITPGE
jgi:hypothetical protein